MKLFIFSENLSFLKRIKIMIAFFGSGLTILMVRNLSLSFETTSPDRLAFFIANVYQTRLPSEESTILLTGNDEKIIDHKNKNHRNNY
ncbi:hypothetical protein [Pantoea sp. CFSAN033090]|uniref:hypothetical protein n=1 Tax=Pantoea sp. CFSAN033090 TaxID=1690502 RepID=UPI0012E1FBE3|nr:hypothetical protein [Pantoea sp. CFSAN033090]